MSSIGRLYGDGESSNSRVLKSRLVAKLSGVNIDFDPSFKFGVDNKSPEYLKKFPLGQTPAFEGKDGLLLTESASIAMYIASQKPNNSLLGSNNNEYYQVLQYVLFCETSVYPLFLEIILRSYGVIPRDAKIETNVYNQLERPLNYLNNQLKGKTYLVGDKLTFADINTFCTFNPFYFIHFDKQDREKYPNVTKYIEHLNNLPKFKELTGGFTFQEERVKF